MPGIRRREFITFAGGAAAWPLAAQAQQPAMPMIGFLSPCSAGTCPYMVDGLRRGLAETGYVEGRNVTIEYRWAEGRYDRLPQLAAELVRQRVDVIFASGSSARFMRHLGHTTRRRTEIKGIDRGCRLA